MICNLFDLAQLNRLGQTHIFVQEFTSSESKREVEKTLGDHLLKQAINELLNDHKKTNENISIIRKGQPKVISDFPLYLSLSHTHGVICAVASVRPVGVDCEHIRSFSTGLKEKFMSREETDMLGLESNESFTQLWCAKEAVSKALGAGFEIDPRGITISIEKEKKEICHAAVEEREQVFTIRFSKVGAAIVALAEQHTYKSNG